MLGECTPFRHHRRWHLLLLLPFVVCGKVNKCKVLTRGRQAKRFDKKPHRTHSKACDIDIWNGIQYWLAHSYCMRLTEHSCCNGLQREKNSAYFGQASSVCCFFVSVILVRYQTNVRFSFDVMDWMICLHAKRMKVGYSEWRRSAQSARNTSEVFRLRWLQAIQFLSISIFNGIALAGELGVYFHWIKVVKSHIGVELKQIAHKLQ